MASREFAALLSALKDPLVERGDPFEVARRKLEAVHGHPIREDTRVERVTLGGVPCAWVDTPETRDVDRTLMLCHGGAYIACGGDGYHFYAEMLAGPCHSRVLLVDYRLAPEHRHPAALDDCVSAYRGLLGEGVAPDRVGFIGDSCGGGLAISALLRLREAGATLPALAVTLGGWFDLEALGESALDPVGFEPFVHRDFVLDRGRDYVGPDGDVRDPQVSPVHADLTGLPALLLQVGQVDITRDDAVRLAARAGRDGVEVTLEVVPDMIHGFQGLASAGIPESVAAIDRVGAFVRARIP